VSTSLYAALLAALLSFLELELSWRKRPAPNAILWLLVLFGFDGASGLFGYWLLGLAFPGLDWLTEPWRVLVAGLVGPALLRSQLALLGSGQEDSYFGPANRVGRLRKGLIDKADDLSAASQSRWASKRAARVMAIGLTEFRFQVETYVDGRDGLSSPVKDDIKDYIETVCADGQASDQQKCRSIIVKLLNSGCRAVVSSASRGGRRP
jgi:hypothetical protein